MRQRSILTTILAAALIAGPGAATAQDWDDEDEEFDDDFGSDFEEEDDDFGGSSSDSTSSTSASATTSTSTRDTASAGGSGEARGIGVGAIAPLANFGAFGAGGLGGLAFFGGAGPAVTYDGGLWHVDGVFALASNDDTAFGLSGRFFYHLFQHDNSDFSLGGGFTFTNVDDEDLDVNLTFFEIEAGANIRMFLVPQVALSATTGLVIGLADADGFAFGGQVLGGITYFFN